VVGGQGKLAAGHAEGRMVVNLHKALKSMIEAPPAVFPAGTEHGGFAFRARVWHSGFRAIKQISAET
jgi:hypothetical protein